MQVGDLVKKQNSHEPPDIGIVLDIMEEFEHALVQSVKSIDCQLWVDCDRLEVLSANR